MYTLQVFAIKVQCRSYSKKTVNQLYIYSTVLGAAIKCRQYSEITVESGTHVKSIKITLKCGEFVLFSTISNHTIPRVVLSETVQSGDPLYSVFWL